MNKNNQDKEFGLLSLEQQFQLQILAIEIEPDCLTHLSESQQE